EPRACVCASCDVVDREPVAASTWPVWVELDTHEAPMHAAKVSCDVRGKASDWHGPARRGGVPRYPWKAGEQQAHVAARRHGGTVQLRGGVARSQRGRAVARADRRG